MMRKLIVVLVVALSMGACCTPSPILKKNIDQLEDTHALIFPEYIKLVEKEYTGKPDGADKIQRRKDLVGTAERKVAAMKEAVKE